MDAVQGEMELQVGKWEGWGRDKQISLNVGLLRPHRPPPSMPSTRRSPRIAAAMFGMSVVEVGMFGMES